MRLADKAIIVTGSTTGIGAAIAQRCLDEGARVLLHGRDRQRGEAMAAAADGRAAMHVDSLEDPEAAPRIVQAAVDAFGKVDAVVNNAASSERALLEETDAAFFDRMMAINARAPLLIVKAAAKHLRQSRGVVLNIGSVNAYCGEGQLLVYSMTKGALMTMSRNMADSFCHDGVRVIHFNVGWVLTPNEKQLKIDDGYPPDWYEHIDPVFAPSGRILKPEEVAAATVYWLSDESAPISGTVLELEQYPIIGRNPTKRGDDA
ncbi:MAG: SDR family oxidoreductase [Planctomycetota bacterium]